MTPDQLKQRGFKDTSFEDEGEKFTEFTLTSNGFVIQISGETLVEISVGGEFSTVPACKTIEDVDYLIRIFTND